MEDTTLKKFLVDLSEEDYRELEYLSQLMGENMNEVLRRAIAFFYYRTLENIKNNVEI